MENSFKKFGILAHHLRLRAMSTPQNMFVANEQLHIKKVYEMTIDLGCHQVTEKDIINYRKRVDKKNDWKVEGHVESFVAYSDFVLSLTDAGLRLLTFCFPEMMDPTFSRGEIEFFIKAIKESYSEIHSAVV